MEKKSVRAVIVGVLVLGLVVAQIEADFVLVCCKTNDKAFNCFNWCINFVHAKWDFCLRNCNCMETTYHDKKICPPDYPFPYNSMLETYGAMVNEYCKLGCASSVCDTITTNQNPGEGKVKEAVDLCNNVCSELCNKGAKTALASA